MKISFDGLIKSFLGKSDVFIGNTNGNNVVIVNGKVISNNVKGIVKIEVEGDLVSLDSAGDVKVNGTIKGNADVTGDLECGDIHGDVDATGDVNCGNISGDIDCIGNIRMKK